MILEMWVFSSPNLAGACVRQRSGRAVGMGGQR